MVPHTRWIPSVCPRQVEPSPFLASHMTSEVLDSRSVCFPRLQSHFSQQSSIQGTKIAVN